MSDSTNAILQQAHELIEANQREQAQELLLPLLETENDNPAFWWVYAHAVTDGAIGSAALDRVLQLDPTYPGARELKEDVLAAQALAAEEIEAQSRPAIGAKSLSDGLEIDDWEEIQPAIEQEAANTGVNRGFAFLIVALLLGAAGLLLVLSGAIDINELASAFSAPTTEPVIVAAVSTAEPATAGAVSTGAAAIVLEPAQPTASAESTVAPAATEQLAAEVQDDVRLEASDTADALGTTEAQPVSVAEFIAAVSSALSDFEIEHDRSGSRSTALGEAIDILVCASPGAQLNERLNAIMDAAVAQYPSLPTGIEAFVVSLVNCAEPNASVRSIGVTRAMLAAYSAAEISRETFQQSWQPLS